MLGNHFQNLGWFLVLGRGAFSDKGQCITFGVILVNFTFWL